MDHSFTPDAAHFTMRGTYYPTGHVFAIFADDATAERAVELVGAIEGVNSARALSPAAIEQAFAQRADEVGGMPSVGREDQFMLRFVELARGGRAGLLIDAGSAESEVLSNALRDAGALLAYHYRNLVIEELVEPTPRAEAAAAGRL